MPMGSRIIFKSHYVKANKNKDGGSGRYAQYIGTREGVVTIADDLKGSPATEKQKNMVEKILNEVPESERLMTYLDYQNDPTMGRASAFISDALDNFGYKVESIDGYAAYMATRPGAVKLRNNGLFSYGNDPIDLNAVRAELKNYHGNVYMPIISLREEDSVKYGYDNPQAWHDLIERHIGDFAKEYRIPKENLRWVGAYHHAVNDEGTVHNHVHLILWSSHPSDGWQSKETGNNLRKVLAKDMFSQELSEIYKQKTEVREAMKDRTAARLYDMSQSIMASGKPELSSTTAAELNELSERLKSYHGRLYYAYMPSDIKQMVDNIMNDMIRDDPKLTQMMSDWAELKDRQKSVFSDGKYILPQPSDIKDFKSVKNSILSAARQMNYDRRTAEKLQREQEYEQKQEDYERSEAEHALRKSINGIAKIFESSSGRGNSGRNLESDFKRDEYEKNRPQRR